MGKFKKRIMELLLLSYMMIAVLILFLLNFSYVQNNRKSITRILNMKFQLVSGVVGDEQQENIGDVEKGSNQDIKEDSYIRKSYLVAKAENGTIYIKNILPDISSSKEQILKIAEDILETGKNAGNYQNYQFEMSVHENELLIAIADISDVKAEEKRYLFVSCLIAVLLGALWIYPAWRITGKMVAPLEEAIRLQKEFVMFAGHELKTPVTVMKASLDMMQKEGFHSKYLDYVVDENEKMHELVIELLDYSKLEYQEEKHVEDKVNLSQCIEGISLEFEAMTYEKGIVLTNDIQKNIIVVGNEEMLRRMTEALLENAIRHTASRERTNISLKKEGKKAILSVENQGHEIAMEERKRIFEKFYHSPDAEEGNYGLGLAIAQSIAWKHHTEITISSENGWNCFSIAFAMGAK